MKSRNASKFAWFGRWLVGATIASIAASPAGATFDAAVSPPRFELEGKAGEIIRQVLTITNGGEQAARYDIKTADWYLDANSRVAYHEGAPAAGSCRPWVKIERHQINLAPRASRGYRFEVHVPPDAKSGECRFALLIAGAAATVVQPGAQQIRIPVVGRLGVIVYVTVGAARPDLRLASLAIKKVDGKPMVAAEFVNLGDAHGRVFGNLEAKDAAGRTFELIVQQSAILPKGRRTLRLHPVDYSTGEPRDAPFDPVAPLHVRGKFQFRGGGEVKVDQVIR
ncbi:MAG: hypothetical protein AMS22_08945 [Thiotrichales bacterium SG8_50]|jgi:fimbrial chaperone protein|nr:MAG: hypothetical protein AMS22_08945 [Thiotrichales bacterium SG8_50]KPL27169.1 MAG: hypothetical protein AMJ72_10445 [Acidithiobacillales bacterium SM1_46]